MDLSRSSVSSDGVKQLAEHLRRVGVGVGVVDWLLVNSPHIHNLSDSEYESLTATVHHILECGFSR